MPATIRELDSRVTHLLERCSPTSRYTDQAIQFVEYERGDDGEARPTGRESRVYGGAWDTWSQCYSADVQPRKVQRYKVSAKQFTVLEAAASGRYHHILVVGARRSSKSELLALWVILRAILHAGIRIGCTFVKHAKAKRWASEKLWPRIAPLCLDGKEGRRKSPDDYGFTLRNGTPIGFLTAEVADDPRGEGMGSAGCDERQIVSQEVQDNVFLSLSEAGDDYQTYENGTALQGEFQEYFEKVEADPDYLVVRLSSYDNPFIGQLFLEDAKRRMDPRRYAQEVEGQFVPQSGVVYHQYERTTHRRPVADARKILVERYGIYQGVGKDITADVCRRWSGSPTERLVGMDFNVAPMCSVELRLFAGPPDVGMIWWAVAEHEVEEGADATRMAIKLKQDGCFPALVVPDASGAHSEGGRSSHRMLRDERFVVIAKKKNPPVVDRINAVNTLLRNSAGHVRLFIDPACRNLIKCLENYKNDDHGKPEKDKIHEHRSDALGYPIDMISPATVDWDREQRAAEQRARAALG